MNRTAKPSINRDSDFGVGGIVEDGKIVGLRGHVVIGSRCYADVTLALTKMFGSYIVEETLPGRRFVFRVDKKMSRTSAEIASAALAMIAAESIEKSVLEESSK
jgi:hypothetical protein